MSGSCIIIMIRAYFYPFVSGLVVLLLSGCNTTDHHTFLQQKSAQIHAQASALVTSNYTLQTLKVTSGKSSTLRVYIEGDGRAWARRSRPSGDPTPRNMLVLDLMAADPATDKAYIARPCQFVMTANCSRTVWTDLRFSQSAVTSFNEALDQLKTDGHYQNIELIGFSGGGAIALLVAAERDDISNIRTIAGNLDPHYVNGIHGVTPMHDALNPASYSRKLEAIPQLHFSGANDTVVPPSVYTHYSGQFPNKHCLAGYTLEGATHNEGWRKHWLKLLNISLPQCVSDLSP